MSSIKYDGKYNVNTKINLVLIGVLIFVTTTILAFGTILFWQNKNNSSINKPLLMNLTITYLPKLRILMDLKNWIVLS